MRVDYIGYALAVLSLIYAYYLHRKGIRIKEPVYSIKSVNVISDYASTYANLAVTYKGDKVENFTVSKVIFFNRGDVTLNRDDIETLNHLKIVSDHPVSILDATVLQVNNPSSDFQISFNHDDDDEWIVIDFEYLNHQQGAVIEVIHTGLSSDDIAVVGDMKDVKNLRRVPKNLMKNISPPNSRRGIADVAQLFIVLITTVGMILTIIGAFQSALSSPIGLSRSLGFCLSGLGVVITIALILVLIVLALNRSTTIPRGLEKFDE